MDNPLSGNDLKSIFNNKIKIITYGELINYDTIEDLLYPYNRVCILYVWKKDPNPYGHWNCIFKNKYGNIEVFDSFGNWIDAFLNDVDKNFRKQNNQLYKQLSHLLYNSHYDVEYNNKKLQNDKSSTCGKWCALRMLKNDLDIDEFNNLFTDDTIKNDRMIIQIFS